MTQTTKTPSIFAFTVSGHLERDNEVILVVVGHNRAGGEYSGTVAIAQSLQQKALPAEAQQHGQRHGCCCPISSPKKIVNAIPKTNKRSI